MANDDHEDATQLGFHGKQDRAYMQSLSSAVVHRTPRLLILVVLIIALFFSSAIFWMSWAEVDVVIRGSGKVSPASQVQNIQSLEGGIVSEILVLEGQEVTMGQPLIKISDVAFSSSFEENRLLSLELLARSYRLNAEAFDEYVKYIANRRLERVGLETQYDGVRNPFPWMSEVIDLAKEKNFFESRVTEYQSSGNLEW